VKIQGAGKTAELADVSDQVLWPGAQPGEQRPEVAPESTASSKTRQRESGMAEVQAQESYHRDTLHVSLLVKPISWLFGRDEHSV
jgi:hypothetical protein